MNLINLGNIFLNIVLIRIPENIFIVFALAFLMKRDKLLDIARIKNNIKTLSLPIIPISILMEVNYQICMALSLEEKLLKLVLIMPLYYLLNVYIIKKSIFEEKENNHVYKKTLFYFILIFVLIGFIEDIYITSILFLLDLPFAYFNGNILKKLVLSLPVKTLEFGIIIFLMKKLGAYKKIICITTII